MHFPPFTTSLKQWEERFDFYTYIVRIFGLNPWISYTQEIKQLWKVPIISTQKINNNKLKRIIIKNWKASNMDGLRMMIQYVFENIENQCKNL